MVLKKISKNRKVTFSSKFFNDFPNKFLALFCEDFVRNLAGFGTVTIFLNGNVYNGVFVRNSRGPDTQRVLGTQKINMLLVTLLVTLSRRRRKFWSIPTVFLL